MDDKEKTNQSRIGMPNKLNNHVIASSKPVKTMQRILTNIPEDVKAITLVIHRPASPVPLVSIAMENKVVNKTDRALRASKLSKNHWLVIQKVYHIFLHMSSRIQNHN